METILGIGLIPILIILVINIMVIWAILRTADNSAKIRQLLEIEFSRREIERNKKSNTNDS
ncbi:MAG: hypothetical protein K8H86_09610 [Ignavibacteriaceae bacterium]|nr:hypothetical protein [Ignavibacteriaceae bacterium]